MAAFLDWKTLDKNQILCLELENELEKIRRYQKKSQPTPLITTIDFDLNQLNYDNYSRQEVGRIHEGQLRRRQKTGRRYRFPCLQLYVSDWLASLMLRQNWAWKSLFIIWRFDIRICLFRFCKDQAFDGRRTSTFMSIMSEVLHCDSTTYSPAHTRLRSYQNFQNLILKHSIERSPVRCGIYCKVKYLLNSFDNFVLPHSIQQHSSFQWKRSGCHYEICCEQVI